jgi:anaerobic selenocysteine-containing dehydrogenase
VKKTACGLDCFDACGIEVIDGKLHADALDPTGNGALCSHLYKHIEQTPHITSARIDGKEVSLEEAMEAVVEAFRTPKSLLWRGSGNVGVMQEVTNLFIQKVGGRLTHGSLCDGAGDAGIVLGRGVNKTLPLEEIEKADTIVVWGRNLTVTNAHILPFIEGKKIVVIDPVATPIAKKADLHLQIAPRTDYYMAIMLSRFLFMEDSEDTTWMDAFAPEYEEFYDYTREHRIKSILAYMGVTLGDMGNMLEYLRNKKVVFLVGTGVQKYSIGASTLHAIDSLAAVLGLFGKEGCGVHYLGNSKLGFENPFEVTCPTVSKVATPFEKFDTVLIQGGNPMASMPHTQKVEERLRGVKRVIYFGLYENETSARADIVIPAKHFLAKEDIRLSYGESYVRPMRCVKPSDEGISEYDFTRYLFDAFGFEGLLAEADYLEMWLSQCTQREGYYLSPAYEPHPYANGFGEEGEEMFTFIEEYDDDFINTKRFKRHRKERQKESEVKAFWLLSPKSSKSLNTQFHRSDTIELSSWLGYKENQRVSVTSPYGSVTLCVKLNDDIRDDCVVVRSSVKGLNRLTPDILSEEGESACFQEVKVELSLVAGEL